MAPPESSVVVYRSMVRVPGSGWDHTAGTVFKDFSRVSSFAAASARHYGRPLTPKPNTRDPRPANDKLTPEASPFQNTPGADSRKRSLDTQARSVAEGGHVKTPRCTAGPRGGLVMHTQTKPRFTQRHEDLTSSSTPHTTHVPANPTYTPVSPSTIHPNPTHATPPHHHGQPAPTTPPPTMDPWMPPTSQDLQLLMRRVQGLQRANRHLQNTLTNYRQMLANPALLNATLGITFT